MNPVNYEPINLDISLTQDLQENVESVQSISVPTKNIGEMDDYIIQHSVISPHEKNIQDIDICYMVEMPDIPTRITDDQVIEEAMLEEEIDFQGIDECKIMELQGVPFEVANEQEQGECMQEEVVSDIIFQRYIEWTKNTYRHKVRNTHNKSRRKVYSAR